MSDRQNLRQSYLQLVEQRQTHYQVTYRVNLDKGNLRFLESTAKLQLDEAGQPLRMVGTLLDISERVQREQRLKASEEKFARAFIPAPTPSSSASATAGAISRSTRALPVSPVTKTGRQSARLSTS